MSSKTRSKERNPMLALVIGIPLASVVFGALMFYFALTSTDSSILVEEAPMSKTSWRAPEDPPR